MTLKQRIRDYLDNCSVQEIDLDNLAPVVRAPVAVGSGKFLSVEDVPNSVDDLPFIPERQRDFAFHYAIEYRRMSQWAKMYNVKVSTISAWLRNPGVQAYIGLIRYQRRVYNFAMSVSLERSAYKALNGVLNKKITSDTIGAVLSAAKFVYNFLNKGSDNTDDSEIKNKVEVNIGGAPQRTEPIVRYIGSKTVDSSKLHELKDEIDELEIVAKSIGVDID